MTDEGGSVGEVVGGGAGFGECWRLGLGMGLLDLVMVVIDDSTVTPLETGKYRWIAALP